MRKGYKLLSLLLTVTFVLQSFASSVFASSPQQSFRISVLHEEYDEQRGIAKQVALVDDLVFYSYVDENLSYCAQITPTGEIQFSYMMMDDRTVMSSELYDIESTWPSYNLAGVDMKYEALNKEIIENIRSFHNVRSVGNAEFVSPSAFGSLSAAITSAFGADYADVFGGNALKTYDNTPYWVYRWDNQTTFHSPIDSYWFAKETALTAIVAWVIGGGWKWVAAALSIVTTVVTSIIVDGVQKTISNFTAERTNVVCQRTRTITVSGYDGIQYWSGWTQHMYFFKGNLGWTRDVDPHYEVKHWDYDNHSHLMEQGFQNFVNYVLNG